jgi:hypothetical protein
MVLTLIQDPHVRRLTSIIFDNALSEFDQVLEERVMSCLYLFTLSLCVCGDEGKER